MNSTSANRFVPANCLSMRAVLQAMAILATVHHATAQVEEFPPEGGYMELRVTGDELKNGTADPSIEYDRDGVGWLAYSVVEIPSRVETHLAKSTDQGKTWQFVSVINPARPDTVKVGWFKRKGMWRHETPALVFDPGDPGKEWKLFTHEYFTTDPYRDRDRRFQHGWIAYRHAPRPDGPWSEPVRLFGGKDVGAQVQLDELHDELRQVLFYTEPGAIVDNGVIYVSLDTNTNWAGMGDWPRRRIILIKSEDHGRSWSYVGTLTDGEDAQRLGYAILTASSLVRVGDRHYLFVSPAGSATKRNKGHDGILIFEFADLSNGKLVRDANGHLQPVRHVPCTGDFGGPGDYHESNRAGGILMFQANLKKSPSILEISSTQRGIDGP